MKLIQINSGEDGKCCDILPPFSVHFCEDQQDDYGYKCADKTGWWIPKDWKTKELPADTPLKECPECKTKFPEDEMFLHNACIVCYERKFVGGDKYLYRQAIRKQLEKEGWVSPEMFK